jgi:hypothetical protein
MDHDRNQVGTKANINFAQVISGVGASFPAFANIGSTSHEELTDGTFSLARASTDWWPRFRIRGDGERDGRVGDSKGKNKKAYTYTLKS